MYVSPLFLTIMMCWISSLESTFVKKQKQNVQFENVIEVLEGSLTECHMKCKLNNNCVKYGTLQNVLMGQITDCYLIGTDRKKYSAKYIPSDENTLEMFVVELEDAFHVHNKKDAFVPLPTPTPQTDAFVPLTTPTPQTVGCPEVDVYYSSVNVSITTLQPSWQVCSHMCDKSEHCASWSYMSSGFELVTSREKCHLKGFTGTDDKQSRPGAISGQKGCIGIWGADARDVTCSSTPYTYTQGARGCNGWSGVNLKECKQKCWRNERPNGCAPTEPHPQCRYVMWFRENTTCHLAKACTTKVKHDGAVLVELKASNGTRN